MISFLWAEDENGLIGNNNQLPWRLPADLQYFKKQTMGHPIVMGRKTYESIGKPLPGRENIILTRDPGYHAEGCTVLHTKEELIGAYQDSDIFITGGSEIFRLFADEADRLYMTKIHEEFAGDTFFPKLDWSRWKLVSSQKGPKDERNPYDYEFRIYERA